MSVLDRKIDESFVRVMGEHERVNEAIAGWAGVPIDEVEGLIDSVTGAFLESINGMTRYEAEVATLKAIKPDATVRDYLVLRSLTSILLTQQEVTSKGDLVERIGGALAPGEDEISVVFFTDNGMRSAITTKAMELLNYLIQMGNMIAPLAQFRMLSKAEPDTGISEESLKEFEKDLKDMLEGKVETISGDEAIRALSGGQGNDVPKDVQDAIDEAREKTLKKLGVGDNPDEQDENVPVATISDSEYETLVDKVEKVLSGKAKSLSADEAIELLKADKTKRNEGGDNDDREGPSED